MTVVPDDPMMTLICDSCGTVATGPACVLPDAEVVWTFVAEQGWTGSPFATGPHRCPRCELVPEPAPVPARAPRRTDPPGVLGVEHTDQVAIVTAAGDLDIATGDDLHGALSEAVDADRHVVVDLVRVHLIDSTALGVLVRARQDARQRGRRLSLAGPSRFVRTALHTMRLDRVFPVFDTRQEAVDWSRAGTADRPRERSAAW
ncbi:MULTISPECIES: STAS domain-containing protein [unclassified Micromonospora]|uniref:STAS domain-containing protein n=1 Tax=unclassified Micromonospora TaxID=2617518 RepID=UPI001C5EF781|nr:STAS domain-containing protein [Micromonospora sp. RL09-050-HVF-A]MBW4701491.1 STAS domain-containing protein [Micromonospora sp. RL09-050-HVF-A]